MDNLMSLMTDALIILFVVGGLYLIYVKFIKGKKIAAPPVKP